MASLGAYSNVYNTCLLALERKGYRLWRTSKDEYWAERNGWDFVAGNPAELFGLVALFEAKKPKEFKEYWWKETGPDLYSSLTRRKPRFTPVWRRKKAAKL